MINECVFVGRLGNDPVLKNLGNTKVCSFILVIEKKFKKKDDTYDTDVSFLNMEAWDTAAELIADKFKKGNWIIVNSASAKTYKMEFQGVEGPRSITLTKFRVNSFNFPSWFDKTRQRDEVNSSDE